MSESVKVTAGKKVQAHIQEVLRDFWLCLVSREVSILARKEVLTGKAKFGIVGDGKEVPQVAMAHAFRKGDWRSGYYRDQTLMFALGLASIEDFFAQLYADPENDPFSGGRQMNGHFATPLIDRDGRWLPLRDMYNISADISSTGGQMARGLGLALASKIYRRSPETGDAEKLSDNGNEVVFVTIGDASTSEGVFWETLNAAAVQQVPLVVCVWDDGYGISVPIEFQTAKKSISKAAAGFHSETVGEGIRIVTARAWDYPDMCRVFADMAEHARSTHQPVLIHVQEVTQPQGHSTSGSHERYKSPERLAWELEYDCIRRMGEWLIEQGFATQEDIDTLKEEAKKTVREAKDRAWKAYTEPILALRTQLTSILEHLANTHAQAGEILQEVKTALNPVYSELVKLARKAAFALRKSDPADLRELHNLIEEAYNRASRSYHTHLYDEGGSSALRVPVIPARYAEDPPLKNGFEILNGFFDHVLSSDDRFYAFGEDVGKIGDVNQGFAGLQAKHGDHRVFDTGIREWTIMGQAIGMAMRGLRPLAEIQYLDYLIYGLEPLTDDLATVRYRSNGMQKAPAIIRTRGHRLEGIWHAGSPIGMLIHSLRGIYLGVPRNMTQAAGMYNTLLQSDDPGLIIECLNGYRLKEPMPENNGEFTVPFGVPEVLQEGTDVTLVTYGSCVRVAQEAVTELAKEHISVELIDVQTLLPFDLEGVIGHSLQRTNRIVFLDEDVPGGATAFMLQEVLEKQGGYRYLDSEPRTITARAHRPPYGSDGDYFAKPNAEDIVQVIHDLMTEVSPGTW